MITTDSVFYSIFVIDIIVCLCCLSTKISKKYSDAANTFSVSGLNFHCVYKEVSKEKPVHFSVRNRRVIYEGEPVSLSMYSPSQVSICFRFLFSCPC